MRYLIVAGVCLLGILALTIREADIPDIKSNVLTEESSMDNQKMSVEESKWNDYWYAGLAEISGYELKQARYGEIHEGQASMIFVSEPFSKKKQVKLDNPEAAGSDKVSVLKLNSTRKFLTGIYPYSMMTSVFNPVNSKNYEGPLKLTLSGQEWCGQVFMQMNKRGKKYDVSAFSYFESEGDQDFTLEARYLEDEVFNLIRLDPKLLPVGKFSMIPSALVSRFIHQDLRPQEAKGTVNATNWKGMDLQEYTIEYAESGRKVSIYYQKDFPFNIEGWEDTYDTYGGKSLTTTALRINTKRIDYWNRNSNKDRSLNTELFEQVDK